MWNLKRHSFEFKQLFVVFLCHFDLDVLRFGEDLQDVVRVAGSVRVHLNHVESDFRAQVLLIHLFGVQA